MAGIVTRKVVGWGTVAGHLLLASINLFCPETKVAHMLFMIELLSKLTSGFEFYWKSFT